MKIKFFFAWYDCWIGWFYDQKKDAIYICPLPCCVFKVSFGEESYFCNCDVQNWYNGNSHCYVCGKLCAPEVQAPHNSAKPDLRPTPPPPSRM